MTVTKDEREAAGFHNGAVWESPSMLRVVLTWLEGDTWGLLSDPDRSRFGGNCMMPHCDRQGKWQFEGDELAERLSGWRYLPNLTLGPLIEKDQA